jgi:hypothetical protein
VSDASGRERRGTERSTDRGPRANPCTLHVTFTPAPLDISGEAARILSPEHLRGPRWASARASADCRDSGFGARGLRREIDEEFEFHLAMIAHELESGACPRGWRARPRKLASATVHSTVKACYRLGRLRQRREVMHELVQDLSTRPACCAMHRASRPWPC